MSTPIVLLGRMDEDQEHLPSEPSTTSRVTGDVGRGGKQMGKFPASCGWVRSSRGYRFTTNQLRTLVAPEERRSNQQRHPDVCADTIVVLILFHRDVPSGEENP